MKSLFDKAELLTPKDVLNFFQSAIKYREFHKDESKK